MGVKDIWSKGALAEELDALSLDMAGVSDKIGESNDTGGTVKDGSLMAKLNAILRYAQSLNESQNTRYDIGGAAYAAEVLINEEFHSTAEYASYVYLGTFVPKYDGTVLVSARFKSTYAGVAVGIYYTTYTATGTDYNDLLSADMTCNEEIDNIYRKSIFASNSNLGDVIAVNSIGAQTERIMANSTTAYKTLYKPLKVTRNYPVNFFANKSTNTSQSIEVYVSNLQILYEMRV